SRPRNRPLGGCAFPRCRRCGPRIGPDPEGTTADLASCERLTADTQKRDGQMNTHQKIDAHERKMAAAIATPIAGYPVDMSVKPVVKGFYDEATATISYIVKDPTSNAAAIIDSVMDIDYAAGRITFDHADMLIGEIERQGLKLEWIIETHAHADHLSA